MYQLFAKKNLSTNVTTTLPHKKKTCNWLPFPTFTYINNNNNNNVKTIRKDKLTQVHHFKRTLFLHLSRCLYQLLDSAAKSAKELTRDKFKIPFTDLKSKINKFPHAKWQQRWNNSNHNKLFQIQLTLGEWKPAFRKPKREQVISRLHIGYTRLTHSFILKQEQQPQCLKCQTPCTVKHILIEFRVVDLTRKPF